MIFALILVIAGCLSLTIHYICKNGIQDILIMIMMNILCNFIAVCILAKIRNELSKTKIKKDRVCKDYLDCIHNGIEKCETIKTMMPKDTDWENLNYEKEIKFYYDSASDYFVFCHALFDDNKEILLDSIRNSFFLDLNFKLMSIVNKICVYKSSTQKRYQDFEKTYEKYGRNKEEFLKLDKREQRRILFDYRILLSGTRHLANGWKDLFKYLGYTYVENGYLTKIKENRFYMTEMEYDYLKGIYEKGVVDVGKEMFNVPEMDIEGMMLCGFQARNFITIKGENDTQYAEITEIGKEALANYKEKHDRRRQ